MAEDGYIYVKLRYTFSGNELQYEAAMPKITELLGTLSLDQRSHQSRVKYMTIGVEELDKCGEKTHKHIHIHMLINDKLASMRKRLQRMFQRVEETRRGNVLYSLVEEDDVKDDCRFFRYVFKQSLTEGFPAENRLIGRYQLYPPDYDISLQSKLAYEEWSRDVEFNKKKLEKLLQPSTKDKLFEYLDAVHQTHSFTNKRDILIMILMYYNQEEKSANQATIMGYLNTALMRYGIMTPEQMADLWLK